MRSFLRASLLMLQFPGDFTVRPLITMLTSLIAVWALTLAIVSADEKDKKADTRDRLVGTWKMVSAKYGGQEVTFPEGSTHMKHITPTHFMWATFDGDGTVSRSCGGTYTLHDDAYVEHVEFGFSSDFDLLKGKSQSFTCKLEGNKWHHNGKLSNGLTIEEVWEREVKK